MASSPEVNFTLLASEWGSKRGGLGTFNRVLAIELAKHSKVHVSVLVPRCDQAEIDDARSKNVTLAQAKRRPGMEEKHWLCFPPDDLQIDVVIGHGVVLGSQAQIIQENRRCKWIQFVHTDPEELGMFKDYSDRIENGEQKHQTEVELCAMADSVVAVGPKLAEAYRQYLRSHDKDQSVFDLTPGIFDEFSGVKQAVQDGDKCRVLAFGRGDAKDFKRKGFDIATKAVGQLQDAILIFVGAGNKQQDGVAGNLQQCDIPPERLRVRTFPESREELRNLFREVDVAIMPSRTEDFGLEALEALSAGLPILVGGNSGFGKALAKVRFGSGFVIQSDDPEVWAEEIKKIWVRDREIRLEESDELRKNYAKKYSWAKRCNDLVELVLKMTPDEEAPSSKRKASNGSGPEPGAGPSASKSRRLSGKSSHQTPKQTRLDVVDSEDEAAPSSKRKASNTSSPEPGAGPSASKSRRLSGKSSHQTPKQTRLDVVDSEDEAAPSSKRKASNTSSPEPGAVAFKDGEPNDRELDELAARIGRKWDRVGLHLHISQEVLDDITVNADDKPREMLLRWINESTSTTLYKDLYEALCHKRVGLNNVAKRFCCKETR